MLKKIVLGAATAVATLAVAGPAFASDGNGGLIANHGGTAAQVTFASDGNGGLIAN